jgi:hypothetical protein
VSDIVERLRRRAETLDALSERDIPAFELTKASWKLESLSAMRRAAKDSCEAADEIERLRALAQQPLPVQEETVAVPKAALDWLFGEGPDASGHWFGDGQYNPKHRGAFWWRAAFRSMLSAPTVGGKEE